MNARLCESFGFLFVYISDMVTCIGSLEFSLKASTVCKCMSAFFMISSSFLVLHTERSTVLVHQPLLSLSSGISHSESIHSFRCSPIKEEQHNLANSGYQILRQREETTHTYPQLLKKINNHPLTQRQIGDSPPFSPLELITMYAGKDSVMTKRQQTGDEAEKERNTVLFGVPRGDSNSIRVNDIIFDHR